MQPKPNRKTNPSKPQTRRRSDRRGNAIRVRLSPLGLIAIVGVLAAAFFGLRALANRPAAAPAGAPPQAAGFNPVATPVAGLPQIAPTAVPAGPIIITETMKGLGNWQFDTSSGPGYRILLESETYVAEATNAAVVNLYKEATFENAVVDVDARWLEGDATDTARFGLTLRKVEGSALYFEVYPHTKTWIVQSGELVNGKDTFTEIKKGAIPTLALRDATAWYHLRADMNGTRIKLYINNVLLGEVSTAKSQTGFIGLMATATDGKRGRFAFDNFSVRQLK